MARQSSSGKSGARALRITGEYESGRELEHRPRRREPVGGLRVRRVDHAVAVPFSSQPVYLRLVLAVHVAAQPMCGEAGAAAPGRDKVRWLRQSEFAGVDATG